MKYTPAQLRAIRLDCRMCIRAAKQGIEDANNGKDVQWTIEDARQALIHYRNEMRQINLAYQAQVYGGDGPPQQTVELESIGIFARAGQI